MRLRKIPQRAAQHVQERAEDLGMSLVKRPPKLLLGSPVGVNNTRQEQDDGALRQVLPVLDQVWEPVENDRPADVDQGFV